MCSSTCLLPVLVEEEESVQDSTAEVSTVTASMEGRTEKAPICVHEGEKEIFLSRLFVYAFLHLSVILTTHTLTLPSRDRAAH